jgi:hypothetical protein
VNLGDPFGLIAEFKNAAARILWDRLRERAWQALNVGLESRSVDEAGAGYDVLSAIQAVEASAIVVTVEMGPIRGFGRSPGGSGPLTSGLGLGIIVDPLREPHIDRLVVLGHELGHVREAVQGTPFTKQWENRAIDLENSVRVLLGCPQRSWLLNAALLHNPACRR